MVSSTERRPAARRVNASVDMLMLVIGPSTCGVEASTLSPVNMACPCGRPSSPSSTRTPTLARIGPVSAEDHRVPGLDLGLPRHDAGAAAASAWSTKTAAAGESRSPGRPIALRMSCSWVQMSNVRIIATVAAGAGPKARG